MTQVPALLALWLTGQAASPDALRGLGGELLHVSADLARREGQSGVISYEGNAELRSDSVLVRADTLSWDEAAQRVEARGHAMLVAGDFVAVADALALDVPAEQVVVTEGLVLQKRNVSTEALRGARTPAELLALGQNALALRGARIQRLGPGRFRVHDVSLTPCDCDPKNPSWRVRAAEAEVVAGESATLRGWQVYVGDVPVLLPGLPIPWAEVPLSNRRSGLLFPGLTFQGPSGFGLEQPLYWAPHPSFDFTFTPGYFFGQGGAEDGTPEAPSSPIGIRGPRLLTEFRYAPVPGMEGRALLGLVYDLRLRRSDTNPFAGVAGTPRGLRGNLSLDHLQDLGRGVSLRANLGLVSDGAYVLDQSADVLGRQTEYTRSTVVLAQRGEDHYLGLDAVLRQDLRNWGSFLVPTAPDTLQRLPGLTFALPERRLAGPVFGGLQLSYARLAPLFGAAPEQHERRDRLDLFPRLSASLPLGQVLRFSPAIAWRQTAYLGEESGTPAARGYPLLEAAAETRLARGFGAPGAAWAHVITPRVLGRWVPVVLGGAAGEYDALDTPFLAAGLGVPQPSRLLQAVADVQQRLLAPGGAEVLRLDVGQGVDLLPLAEGTGSARLGDLYGRLTGHLGRFSGDAGVRVNPLSRDVTQTSLGLSVDFGAVAGLSARFHDFLYVGSDRMRRGVDALVGLLPPDVTVPIPTGPDGKPARAQQVQLQGRWAPPLRGLGLSADVLYEPLFTGKPLASAMLGVSLAPACDCWRLDVRAGAIRTPGTDGAPLQPNVGFSLTIANFGSLGV